MTARNRLLNLILPCIAVLLLSGCSETELVSHWMKKVTWPGQTESAGTYKVGKPYRVGSVWYYPQEDFRLSETGIASWYGPDFHGHSTANGERYDQNELTAAHRTLQMPSLVRVTNLENGRSVVVRINDRGPYMHGRVIDVSKRAAELLGFIGRGTARVRLDVMTRESRQIAEAAKRGTDTSRLTMADLAKYDTPQSDIPQSVPAGSQPVRVASRSSDTDALPESLQTPTITVEELSAPPASSSRHVYDEPAPRAQPVYTAPVSSAPSSSASREQREKEQERQMMEMDEQPPAAAPQTASGLVPGHVNKEGHFMPAPVVRQESVGRTAIYVQAGAFAVRANADRLKQNLQGVAPVQIDPVQSGGKTLYRVKLGPIESVSKADAVLERVIALGNHTAHVVHDR